MKPSTTSCLNGSAVAFTPAHIGCTSTNLAVNELDLGVTEPLRAYDLLRWIKTGPKSFEIHRDVEHKHRRICMISLIGQVVYANNGIVFDG